MNHDINTIKPALEPIYDRIEVPESVTADALLPRLSSDVPAGRFLSDDTIEFLRTISRRHALSMAAAAFVVAVSIYAYTGNFSIAQNSGDMIAAPDIGRMMPIGEQIESGIFASRDMPVIETEAVFEEMADYDDGVYAETAAGAAPVFDDAVATFDDTDYEIDVIYDDDEFDSGVTAEFVVRAADIVNELWMVSDNVYQIRDKFIFITSENGMTAANLTGIADGAFMNTVTTAVGDFISLEHGDNDVIILVTNQTRVVVESDIHQYETRPDRMYPDIPPEPHDDDDM
jgi:hypothetical protein